MGSALLLKEKEGFRAVKSHTLREAKNGLVQLQFLKHERDKSTQLVKLNLERTNTVVIAVLGEWSFFISKTSQTSFSSSIYSPIDLSILMVIFTSFSSQL